MSKDRSATMPIIRMKTIQEPEEGTRTVLTGTDVLLGGSGTYDLICGNCESTLAQRMEYRQVQNMVLHCNKCGSYNESPW